MKRYYLIYLAGALALIAALGGGIALAQDGGPDDPIGPQGVADALGTSFTYQGKLEQDGSPVSGDCPMRFRLYDDAGGGSQVGDVITRTVTITDGLFTESLDFGADAFTGDRRWLEIMADCDGDGSYADLGRQELTAAPYALGLRPGAVISGATTALRLSGTDTGLRALGSLWGVRADGDTADLRLEGSSGVLWAKGEQQSDLKVHSNSDVDVHLDDAGYTPNAQFRIFNDADSAVFTVTENSAIHWQPITGYVSIPAAAFRPEEDGYDFINYGSELNNNDGNSDEYYAPVQLPHGAIVTEMTFYWFDASSADDGVATLLRGTTSGGYNQMARADTSGDSGDGDSFDNSISYAVVDNSQYTYHLKWLLRDANIKGYFVVIEYTYTGPH